MIDIDIQISERSSGWATNYCSPGQPSTKTFHLFDMSRFQRRLERNQLLPSIYVSNIFEPQLLIVFRFACGWRLLLQSKKRWVDEGRTGGRLGRGDRGDRGGQEVD